MKKIYTLLAATLLTVTTAFAQTLEVIVDGVTMENGKDYTLNYTEDEIKTFVPGDEFDSYVYAMKPEILVKTTVTQTVYVTAEDLDKPSGKPEEGTAQICFGGSCEPLTSPTYSVTKSSEMKAGSSLDTEMHIDFGSVMIMDGEVWGDIPTFPIERHIKLTVKAGSEEISLVLTYVCDPENKLSVNGVSADNAVNATAEGISYTLSAAGTLDVYSANGAAIMHKTVGGNGTVSFSALPAGVYVYNLKADGKNYSGKVAVK